MAWVIYLFGSGLMLYVGTVCLAASLIAFGVKRRRWQLFAANLLCLLASLLIALSAAPLSYWYYGITGTTVSVMFVAEQLANPRIAKWKARLRLLCGLCCAVGMALDAPYQLVPSLPSKTVPELHIIADSVTAGVDEPGIQTWPKLLARSRKVVVHDYSRMGATVTSAYSQAEKLPTGKLSLGDGLTLIELGGNDVLGSTPLATFERGLDRLLTRARSGGRPVLMFEIPLPPLCNNYGAIQRQLANRHGVELIPKRVLIGVLTSRGATTDSIHMSQAGHDKMAAVVWNLIGARSTDLR